MKRGLRFKGRASRALPQRGYLLTEALVYIGAVFVLLGAGFVAMYRCVDNSVVLQRNATDIARSMHAGELWRADVRIGVKGLRFQESEGQKTLQIEGITNRIEYRFVEGAVYRRTGSGPWVRVLEKVKASSMHSESRPEITAWYWDLELQPEGRGAARAGRVRPLFTFIAVPHRTEAP